MPSNPQPKTDHVEEARSFLENGCKFLDEGRMERSSSYHRIAQVHASIAIAEGLRDLQRTLGDYLGDDSNLDQIAQALRAIAEPGKYGIDPRGLSQTTTERSEG